MHAFVWDPGSGMHELGTFGGSNSHAYGSDAGYVVGYANIPGNVSHAFLWTAGGGMVDLGTLPGGTVSEAYGVNNLRQVVGYSGVTGGVFHASFDILRQPAA